VLPAWWLMRRCSTQTSSLPATHDSLQQNCLSQISLHLAPCPCLAPPYPVPPCPPPCPALACRVDPFDPDSPIKQMGIEKFPPDMFFVLRVVQVGLPCAAVCSVLCPLCMPGAPGCTLECRHRRSQVQWFGCRTDAAACHVRCCRPSCSCCGVLLRA
jgi:hypothetical protein